MTDAIAGTFSDFRLIKGRKVAQFIIEVPLETADQALAALGGIPNPHAEKWVGIARLKDNPDGGSNQDNPKSATIAPPQAQARGAAEPATPRKRGRLEIEAYEMCRSAEFSEWCRFSSPRKRWNNEHVIASRMPNKEWIETFPASYVKWYCGVNHRHEIDTDPEAAARWRELMRMFQERSR